jgi:hypothetical protein
MLLKEKLEICDLHLNRLNVAFQKIKKYYPFNENKFPLENYEDLAFLDMFTGRFAKLQDYMGEKLFPEVLIIFGNTNQTLSYIDILNNLEKNGILESVKKWRELRELRNKISHEYPSSYKEQCETLNKIVDDFPYLEEVINKIKAEIEIYECSLRA